MTSQDSTQNDYPKPLQNRTFALAIITKSHTHTPPLLGTDDQANESAHWFCYALC